MKEVAKASVTWWVLHAIKSILWKRQVLKEMKAKPLPEEVLFHRSVGQWQLFFPFASTLQKRRNMRVTTPGWQAEPLPLGNSSSRAQLNSTSSHVKCSFYVSVPAEARISMVLSQRVQAELPSSRLIISMMALGDHPSPSICFGPFHNNKTPL